MCGPAKGFVKTVMIFGVHNRRGVFNQVDNCQLMHVVGNMKRIEVCCSNCVSLRFSVRTGNWRDTVQSRRRCCPQQCVLLGEVDGLWWSMSACNKTTHLLQIIFSLPHLARGAVIVLVKKPCEKKVPRCGLAADWCDFKKSVWLWKNSWRNATVSAIILLLS